MITLGGITISDNMYVGGITEAAQIAYQQEFTVEGMSKIKIVQLQGGRVITLESTQLNGSIQGIWCQHVIDAVKALEAKAQLCTLQVNGDTYQVYIVDTTDFQQLFQFEPVSPNKKYTGKITMIEG